MPAVSADVPTGQNPRGVQLGPPPALHDPAGLRSLGAQYPFQSLQMAALKLKGLSIPFDLFSSDIFIYYFMQLVPGTSSSMT